MIMPRSSDMSLGSQDGGLDDNVSLDQTLFETLNNVNYRTVLGNVVSLAMSDVSVNVAAAAKTVPVMLYQNPQALCQLF